ncbi:MAG: hypothetical protein HY319_18390 [Armatimonadetes bacterium]|nr:hypothetical protein [Armatimonadota bacterium]
MRGWPGEILIVVSLPAGAQNGLKLHFTRQRDGRWLLTELSEKDQVLDLASIGCGVSLGEIYDKVELPAPGSAELRSEMTP